MIINLLSNPRNCSTALMYSFRQHPSIKVIDEPFYAYYLKLSNKDHPGRDEILSSLPHQIPKILELIREQGEVVFIKNMAHHLQQLDLSVLLDWINVFLIRNPEESIFSFSKVITTPNHDDIGLKQQILIAEYLTQNDQSYYVIDSGELLTDPDAVLSQFFDAISFPYDQAMLEWPKGPKPEDGIWAKYWYENVHRSTGFQKPKKKDILLTEYQKSLLAECKDIHYHFYNQSIKA